MKKGYSVRAIKSSLSCLILFALFGMAFTSCKQKDNNANDPVASKQKIGVLLVNHGSRSETWRKALMDLEASVRD
ncbi:MAG: cobalamin biosynthesis protein CbiX, partial [Bacteroidota bacterium]